MPTIPTIRPITVEATAVFKGIEMTHGNSAHYLTFELDSGERIYFQVSMKCYMLILEGDRCLITYKSLTNSPKKKLKAFERIGANNFVSTPVEVEQLDSPQMGNSQIGNTQLGIEEPIREQEVESFVDERNEVANSTTGLMQQKLEESRKSLATLRERQTKV